MLLRLLLQTLGTLMGLASRTSDRFRCQITRDLVFEVRSDDGVAHHYAFRDRRVAGRAGRAAQPACSLRFATARQGFACLTARDGPQRLVQGLFDGSISVEGNPALLLWFQGLPGALLPDALVALSPPLRLPATPPGAYRVPKPSSPASRFITREAAVAELDPEWRSAARQRAKLRMLRTAAGKPHPLF